MFSAGHAGGGQGWESDHLEPFFLALAALRLGPGSVSKLGCARAACSPRTRSSSPRPPRQSAHQNGSPQYATIYFGADRGWLERIALAVHDGEDLGFGKQIDESCDPAP